ncbi:hypothetical protein EVB32_001 [Rhizobium phage RHph_TM39]|uniref:SWIM-type domain-containing protein n=1 Tax=Rhizobium phage RHph_TM30 TaxID=2509764 RepID=A0A7S5UXD7_9CAUD|nr:hypothetical protein PQC16_gp001 [Rhizobium phage RHph_TM30]QIG71472.1 hypothetical protein EVB94_001 [Rhizobium phage RHph_TM40]QIG72197.1 hypothetical protein EVB96_001 [Rhizobium phage RHph_TM3_3_6]QIG76989.1 hypothetical protein EVB32_001 [Rhizobium phage RHph_TM39]QIG77329.1 hypothetical protein EVB61_001 [Rhizobium phage RHph_TM21B]QIG77588.1 hypothetical protein EVB64_001 [Rhizobium phage RHph_TM61]
MFYTIKKNSENSDYKISSFNDYETHPNNTYELKVRGRAVYCNCPASRHACRHVQMYWRTKEQSLLDKPNLIDFTNNSEMIVKPIKAFIVE